MIINYTGSDIAARGQYYGQAIAERATNLEEFKQLLLSAPKANRQGMEFLTNACWDSLRSIGARVGYGDDVLSAGHPVWTLSTSMGSAGVGFCDQQKDREGSL